MSDDIKLSKVEILIEQKKFKEAQNLLSDLLALEPNNIHLLSLLAEVNFQQDKYDIANQIIDNAIGLAPDVPHLFYVKARIAIEQEDYNEAEKHLNHAIKLDPFDADYFALLATIKLQRKQFEKALSMANKALEIDAENLLALNTRSTALYKLDKTEESYETIEGALREDPNNAYTHANYGWGLLEKGNHKKALEHFKESLKSDPTYSYAQAGMLEALKASNPIYRIFMKYYFWMGNLTSKYQWGVIIGFYLGTKLLSGIANTFEAVEPFLTPLIILLAIFAFSTWVITPISNLFLRFNKYGQYLLNKNEKMSSNFVAVSVAIFAIGLLLYMALSDERYLAIAAFGFAMMVPCSVMLSPSKYNSLLIYAVAMFLVGVSAIGIVFSTGEIFNTMSTIFIFGFIGFQWFANLLFIKSDNS